MIHHQTFNRTILELKYRKGHTRVTLCASLQPHHTGIEIFVGPVLGIAAAAFNRTILELKLSSRIVLNVLQHPFNRTILELK